MHLHCTTATFNFFINTWIDPHQKAKIDLFMEPGSRALKSGSGSGAGVGTGTGNPGTAIHLSVY